MEQKTNSIKHRSCFAYVQYLQIALEIVFSVKVQSSIAGGKVNRNRPLLCLSVPAVFVCSCTSVCLRSACRPHWWCHLSLSSWLMTLPSISVSLCVFVRASSCSTHSGADWTTHYGAPTHNPTSQRGWDEAFNTLMFNVVDNPCSWHIMSF